MNCKTCGCGAGDEELVSLRAEIASCRSEVDRLKEENEKLKSDHKRWQELLDVAGPQSERIIYLLAMCDELAGALENISRDGTATMMHGHRFVAKQAFERYTAFRSGEK